MVACLEIASLGGWLLGSHTQGYAVGAWLEGRRGMENACLGGRAVSRADAFHNCAQQRSQQQGRACCCCATHSDDAIGCWRKTKERPLFFHERCRGALSRWCGAVLACTAPARPHGCMPHAQPPPPTSTMGPELCITLRRVAARVQAQRRARFERPGRPHCGGLRHQAMLAMTTVRMMVPTGQVTTTTSATRTKTARLDAREAARAPQQRTTSLKAAQRRLSIQQTSKALLQRCTLKAKTTMTAPLKT